MNLLTDLHVTQAVVDAAKQKGLSIQLEYAESPENHDNPRILASSSMVATKYSVLANCADELLHGCDCGGNISDAIAAYANTQGLEVADMLWWRIFSSTDGKGNLMLDTTIFKHAPDSEVVGFIFLKKSEIREEFEVKRVSAELIARLGQRIKGELVMVANHLNGEVLELSIIDSEGDVKDERAVWSDGGMYISDLAERLVASIEVEAV